MYVYDINIILLKIYLLYRFLLKKKMFKFKWNFIKKKKIIIIKKKYSTYAGPDYKFKRKN